MRLHAERLIAAYVAPKSDRLSIIDQLIRLFDRPHQREAQHLGREVLSENLGNVV